MVTIARFILSNKDSILRFFSVGLLNALFYFFLFTLFWKWFNINYTISITIAYSIAIISYFFLTRHFTFRSKSNPIKAQLRRFIVLLTLNYVITLIVVHNTVRMLLLPPNIGVIFAIAITTISSYLLGKFWVFRHSTLIQIEEKN